MSDANLWQQVLNHLQAALTPEDFRRWFSGTSYASDSGDQVTVWVPSEGVRRHINTHYADLIDRALATLDRAGTAVRFVPAGYGEEEEGEEV